MTKRRSRIAVIGECLIELRGTPFGAMQQTFGGDSLNTALYMARLAGDTLDVSYISVMGVDSLSDAIVQKWQEEGINVTFVLRDPVRIPGLYLIEVESDGERRFLYWRDQSAARYLLRHSSFVQIDAELPYFDLIYLSGISLAILPEEDREALIERLIRLARGGIEIAFDTNFRPVLWPDPQAACDALGRLLPAISLVLTSFEDEQRLWGDVAPEASIGRLHAAGVSTVVLKSGSAAVLCSEGMGALHVHPHPVPRVVDTTAAGDSFNAAFIAGRLNGFADGVCCELGNALARVVIQHPGAIISRLATPSLAELVARDDSARHHIGS